MNVQVAHHFGEHSILFPTHTLVYYFWISSFQKIPFKSYRSNENVPTLRWMVFRLLLIFLLTEMVRKSDVPFQPFIRGTSVTSVTNLIVKYRFQFICDYCWISNSYRWISIEITPEYKMIDLKLKCYEPLLHWKYIQFVYIR